MDQDLRVAGPLTKLGGNRRRQLPLAIAVFAALLVVNLSPGEANDEEPPLFPPESPPTTITGDSTTATTIPKLKGMPPDDSRLVPVARASTDFAGGGIDTDMWSLYDGPGNEGVGLRRPSAISVSDNYLTISARGNVSGGLSQHHGQTYGRWVVRARMDKGQGYGPAILLWPDSERWPIDGEIDIVEMPTGDRSQAISTAHYGRDNRQLGRTTFGDFSDWHTYAVDWLPDRVVFYIDGKETYRIHDPVAIPTKPMHLAIQNDIGACNSWIGCRDETTPEVVRLQVESIRVFSYEATD